MSSVEATASEAFEERYQENRQNLTADQKRWHYFWLALAVMAVPMLVPYLLAMWDQEHYQYFPFVFLVVGYLAYTRSDRRLHAPRGVLGWSLIGLGILGSVAALLLPSAWMAGLSFVFLAAACLHSLKSEGSGRSLIGCAIPLIMLIQAPIGLDNRLISTLQGITTRLGSVVLDVIRIPHAIQGNIIQLADRELFVAEACSGIQSVFTLAFMACVIVTWRDRRVWLTPLYLLIAVILAVVGNTVRVTMVAVAHHFFGMDWASGWQHDVLGYATLALAGVFLLSFDHLIQTVLHPVSSSGRDSSENLILRAYNFFVSDIRFEDDDTTYGGYSNFTRDQDQTSKTNRADWFNQLILGKVGWVATLTIVGVCFVGALIQSMRVEVNRAPELLLREIVLFEPEPDMLGSEEFDLIKIVDHKLTRNGSEPRLGQNADVWEFRADRLMGQIVVSQTYSGWHELCVCYQNMNWDLVDRDVTEPIELIRGDSEWSSDAAVGEDAVDEESFVTARFRKGDKTYGYLLFTAVHDDGTVPDAPSTYGAFGARFLSRLERYGAISQKNLVMLQMWVTAQERIPRRVLDSLRKDFIRVRSRVSQELQPSNEASPVAIRKPSRLESLLTAQHQHKTNFGAN
ncbi:MAG: exosortase U [Planctomycetota bacterium]